MQMENDQRCFAKSYYTWSNAYHVLLLIVNQNQSIGSRNTELSFQTMVDTIYIQYTAVLQKIIAATVDHNLKYIK